MRVQHSYPAHATLYNLRAPPPEALKKLAANMSSPQVLQNPSIQDPINLPELNPIREEESKQIPDGVQTQSGDNKKLQQSSTYTTKAENLMKLLRLATGSDEVPTGALLRTVKMEIVAALEELRVITTHDDNLEKQYKETVAENTRLQLDLDKARREIRHLKGQLSLLQMTPADIREERARTQQREKRKAEYERKIKQQRKLHPDDSVTILTADERARTVNAKGEYIDHHKSKHSRRSTYPSSLPPEAIASTSHGKRKKLDPLPPTIIDCTCSVCNSKQSFGALTLGKGEGCSHTTSQMTRSGQQILIGDRVVIKAERLGSVCYIGKLDFDPSDTIYVGIHLDLPIGNCDGLLKGRRYFHCPANHGVFVRSSDVICVTGRKPLSGGTAIPRIRERLPSGLEISRSTKRASKTPSKLATPAGNTSTATSSITMSQVRTTVESEMEMLKEREPEDLTDPSTAEMSRRMKELAEKQQRAAREAEDKPSEPRTPPSSPLQDQPSFSTPLPGLPPPAARPETPLERTLLELLNDKDLGATGFVTASELAAVLVSLPDGKALSEDQIQKLFINLGINTDEGLGLAYHALVPYIMQALEH